MPRRSLFLASSIALAMAAMPSGALADPAHASAHAQGKSDNAASGKGNRPAGTGGGRRIR